MYLLFNKYYSSELLYINKRFCKNTKLVAGKEQNIFIRCYTAKIRLLFALYCYLQSLLKAAIVQ